VLCRATLCKMLWLRPDRFLIAPPPAPAPGLETPAPARRGAAAGAAEKEKEPRDPADAAVAPAVEVVEADRVEVVVRAQTPREACEVCQRNFKSCATGCYDAPCCCHICWLFTLLLLAYITYGVINGGDKTTIIVYFVFLGMLPFCCCLIVVFPKCSECLDICGTICLIAH